MNRSRLLFSTIILLGLFVSSFAIVRSQTLYRGPVPRITSGFGADGAFAVDTLRFPASGWEGAASTPNVEVYYPRGSTTPRPTMLFAHGFGGNDPRYYGELLRNVVSRGYAAVFVPYPISINLAGLYRTLDSGFAEAVRRFSTVIDSTRIGFAGHSFGAGAIPSIAFKAFTTRKWGANGKFLFPMAPWYSLETTQEQLRSFPGDTKLLMQIYADDATNDHRMAMDIFININIPNSEKDFITVFADTVQGYSYTAGHQLCTIQTPTGGVFDGYDYYAVFRPLDALMQYTFNTANTAAKNVALGNGSAEQVFMGTVDNRILKPMTVTDRPTPLSTAPRAGFQCDNATNTRRDYCSLQAPVAVREETRPFARLFPQPASDRAVLSLRLQAAQTLTVSIFDILGRERLRVLPETPLSAGNHDIEIALASLPSGAYLCRLVANGSFTSLPLLVQP
ncbi:MAG: T9SS type A sorting domain-containing protein [Ignavibacteria bacterium]|nr:T9SS type A sorting domain-containing protein [Ignavibacteria bacterium]